MNNELKKEELYSLILKSAELFSEDLKSIWNDIKISPEEWNESTTARDYWVVAVMNDEVIWYNDIEKGFNISKFTNEGEIGEYWGERCSLDELLWHLF